MATTPKLWRRNLGWLAYHLCTGTPPDQIAKEDNVSTKTVERGIQDAARYVPLRPLAAPLDNLTRD